MTWEILAQDIAARIEHDDRENLFADALELADAERATQLFMDRIRAHTGREVAISIDSPAEPFVSGQLVTSGEEWLLIRNETYQHLVMSHAVTSLGSPALSQEAPSGLPVSIGSMLRGIQGAYVTVTCFGRTVAGELIGVGKDFLVLDLASQLARRGSYAESWQARYGYADEQSLEETSIALPFRAVLMVSQAHVHSAR